MPARQKVGRRDTRRNVSRVLPVRISRLRRLSQRLPGAITLAFGRGSTEIRGSPRLDPKLVPHFKIGVSPQTDQEASMEQFVHQQNIAIFRRLLSTQTDSDEARRERLLELLAAEEAKSILSSQHDVSPGSPFSNPG
jgi:hypothetical protein